MKRASVSRKPEPPKRASAGLRRNAEALARLGWLVPLLWPSLNLGVLSAAWAQSPPASSQDAPEAIVPPKLVRFVEADYPVEALSARRAGVVTLRLEIGVDGHVTRADVVEAAGFGLDDAACAASVQFEFEPARRGDVPVVAQISYRYEFRLPELAAANERQRPLVSETPPASAKTPIAAVSPPASHPEAEVVVTGTRTAETLQKSTLRTGVVTRAEAQRRGALNVAEALAGEPGLQVSPRAYAYAGSPAGIQMQGLDAERVLILRDGERVVGDSDGVVDLAQFSLSGVQRIEYVLGPTSSLYGAGALGGVVNIITGAPRAEGPSGQARLEWRSLPEYSAELDLAYKRGEFWIAPNAGYFWGGSLPYVEGRPERLYPQRKRVTLGAAVGRERDDSESVIEARFTRNESMGLTSTLVPMLGEYFIDLPDVADRWEAKVRQRERFGDDVQLDASLASQWFSGRGSRDLRNSPLDEHRTRRQELTSAEAMLSYWDGPRTWIVGVRAEHEAFHQELERFVADGAEAAPVTIEEVPKMNLLSAALFGQLGWKLNDAWTLLPGLRGELHDSVGVVAAPRLAAAYGPLPQLRVRAGGGRGFRVPSAKEYGFLFDHGALGYRVLGSSELRPESSWGVNADVGIGLSSELRLQLGAFHNWVNNLIDMEFVGQDIPGIDDFGYVNIGHARTFGSDVNLTWIVGSKFRSQLGYSYLFTRNEESGTPLASRPHHTVLSTFSYEPFEDTQLTFRQRAVSRAWISPGLFSPPYATADILCSQRFNAYLELHAGVLNALDIKEEPLGEGDQRPVTGRMYVIGLSGSYEGDLE